MVDTAIVGHIPFKTEATDYIGAVAVGSMIFNMIYWNFGFLRASMSGFASQAYGAEDKKEQADVLLRGLFIAFIAALLLLSLQRPIGYLANFLIDDTNGVMDLALKYFYIRIWASPAVLSMYCLKGWFIGMQDSKTPMYTAIVINLVNIAFDIYFVFVKNMDVDGVALATVIAQYSGLVMISLIFLLKYKNALRFSLKRALKSNKMRRFFKVNGDIYLRALCLIGVTTFFTAASSYMPYPTLAANTLIMQLFTLFSYFMDGFAYACEALCGKHYGAGRQKDLKETVMAVIHWGIGMCVVAMIVYGLFAEGILSLLTNHKDVLLMCKDYKIWIILIPLTGFLAFLYDGILIGITQTTLMRNAIFIATAAFFSAYFLLGQTNHSLWFAFILYLSLRSVLMMCWSWKKIFSTNKYV